MTDASTHPTPQPPDQTRNEQNFDHLNPSFAADQAARADDTPGLRTVEDGLARGWAVTLSEHLENTGPSGWRHQHVADRAFYAGERAVRAEREVLSDTEDAFARLNPDFGVLPDARDAGQHAFAQQREAALALGTRAAVAVMDEAHPDREQRQAAITARARTAARPGRGDRLCQARQDRPQSPAAPRRAERLEPLAAGCAEREDLAGFTQPVAAAVLAGGPELTALFSEKGTGDSWIPVRELARGEGGKAVGLATSFTSTMVDVATPKQLKASLQGLLPASVTLSSGPAQAWSVGSSATGSGAT